MGSGPPWDRRSLGVSEQLNQRRGRSPIIRRMSHRGRVEIEEAHQDFADNARANRSEPIATAPNISLALDVVPERRLTAPTNPRSADFVTGQRCFIETTRDGLARWKSDTLSALEIADGKGVELFDMGLTRQCDRKSDERADQTAINLLGASRRRSAARIEETRPVDTVIARHRSKSDQVWKDRRRRARAVQRVRVTNLRVSIAICRVGELEGNKGFVRRTIKAGALVQQASHQIGADKLWEKLP